MKIRTLIVDDEPLGRRLIARLLAGDPEFEEVGQCEDGAEAVAAIKRESPDLVFLDVQMPQLNGFEVLANLQEDEIPLIIFVTAFDSFALKAFEAHALDYLLKPIADDRFSLALQKAKTFSTGKEQSAFRDRLLRLIGELRRPAKYLSRLAVEFNGRVVFINSADVDWIEAAGNYLNLHVGKQTYFLRGRIGEFAKSLSPEQFFRVHRSIIVNLDRVKEFQPLFKGEGLIVLKDGSQLSASRDGSRKLRALLRPRV